jgi:ABC-2 type transport system permease protein
MNSFAGTWRLVKLALRRDRIKLPAWIAIVSGVAALTASAIQGAFPTVEDRITYATTVSGSVVSRAFEGVVDGISFGSIITTELFVFTALLVAFMSTLAVVRHTRLNEETGSAELISSTPVGRYAGLSAALIVVIAANILTGLLIFASLSGNENLSTTGSFMLGMTLSAAGITFASIAAVVAQVADSSRSANSMAGMAIGLAFILRATGDAFGTVSADGLSIESSWPSWLSPIGWGQQVFPYTQQNWWIFSLFAGLSAVMVGASFLLLKRRDIGLGLIAARKGPANASPRLLSPLGLGWRLQRGILYGWIIGLVVYGGIIGGIAKEFEQLINDNELMQEFFGNTDGNFTDVLFASMFIYVGAIAVAYCAQALLKMRSEETNLHLETIVGTPTSRVHWMASHIFWVLIGIVLVMFASGLAAGVVNTLITDAGWIDALRIGGIALVQLPPILAVAGLIVLVYGLWPNFSSLFAWGSFVGILLITQIGALLRLPQWFMNISPFGHMSLYPVEPLAYTPMAVMLCIAVAGTVIGLYGFRRRDLQSS